MRRVFEHDGVTRIEWKFDNESERKMYLATRRPLSHELALFGIPVALLLVFGIALIIERVNVMLLVNFVCLTAFGIFEVVRRRTRSLEGIQVSFKKDRIESIEHVNWLASKGKHLYTLRCRFMQVAKWDVDGLLFVGRFLLPYKIVVSYRVLGDEGIAIAEEWCRRNGIEIEGVKPLPGSYERPVAHPRGL